MKPIKFLSLCLISILVSSCTNEKEKRKKQIFQEGSKVISSALAEVMVKGFPINSDSVMSGFIAAGKDSAELGMVYAENFKAWVDAELPAAIERQKLFKEKENLEKLKIQLTAEIQNLKTFDGSHLHTSVQGMQTELQFFKDWADVARKADGVDDDTIAALGKQLRTEIARVQKRDFPKLRKACATLLKEKFWVQDVEVSLSGTGASTLTFAGGVFAANKNKQDFQNAFQENYGRFRFKQTRYKWYSGSSEYTYYDMKAPSDDQLED